MLRERVTFSRRLSLLLRSHFDHKKLAVPNSQRNVRDLSPASSLLSRRGSKIPGIPDETSYAAVFLLSVTTRSILSSFSAAASSLAIRISLKMGGDGGTKAVNRSYLRGAGAATTSADLARHNKKDPAVAAEEATARPDALCHFRSAP